MTGSPLLPISHRLIYTNQQNKSLSGDLNTLLQLQGVSWLVRRALTGINSSMLMSQSTSNKTTKITITNIASSVIKGTTENMILDGQFHDHKDYIWGAVRSKTRFVHTRDIRNNGDDEFFGQWSQDMQEGDCILTESEAMDGSWTSTMVGLGFNQLINLPCVWVNKTNRKKLGLGVQDAQRCPSFRPSCYRPECVQVVLGDASV